MTRRVFSYLGAPAFLAALIALAPTHLAGQTAGVARTAGGKPDLSGIWQAVNTASWDIQDHHAQRGVPAGPGVVDGGEVPYQPWAAAKKKENFDNRLTADPNNRVLLLEAGGKDTDPWIHIPAGFYRNIYNPKVAWHFETEPVPEMHNRRIA